ncbi:MULTISPECIES: hypothetical protein [Pseudomonas]|uniref:Restriction endonuclease n=1 Tax=Pseudomonas mosselii TaxID=78327 RepID=A0A5R8Z4J1_9PSED|nr:hypothetical protein [Pseudomonas mosselii]TLP60057.1 hypothetical protein FEM01_12685 [Pseudomonas mosselii]
MSRNYWGYRIDKRNIEFFRKKLDQGRLHQGWGKIPEQDLTNPDLSGGAKRNLPIYNKVKKGDILLVPRLPNHHEVAIVEAAEDFNLGYTYLPDPVLKDYGHSFPVRRLKQFTRKNTNVSGKIRAALGSRSRFWNLNSCADEIEALIAIDDEAMRSSQSFIDRFSEAVQDSFADSFDEHKFTTLLYQKVVRGFSSAEWEFALIEGLKRLFPSPCKVARRGGREEIHHGTDISITIPGLADYSYLIAIQVKDYIGEVSEAPLIQINKAGTYWGNDPKIRLIDKVLIVTKAHAEQNRHLIDNQDGITVLFGHDVQNLLLKIGKAYKGLQS